VGRDSIGRHLISQSIVIGAMDRKPTGSTHRTSAGTAGDLGRGGCNVSELFSMLGQPHMLRLLSALVESDPASLRFTEIQGRLGLSPKTLSLRLRTLVEGGFVTRRSFREIPPRVEYQATAKLVRLSQLFEILREWAEENTMHATPTVSVVGRMPIRAVTSGN